MRFTTIKLTKKGGRCEYIDENAKGGEKTIVYKSAEPPLSDYTDALKAFVPYVLDLIDAPLAWRDSIVVTGIVVKAPDADGVRGLTVSFYRLCEKANGRAMQSNTPFMPEAGDETSENVRTLDDATVELIEAAERAAARYIDGLHGEQTSIFDGADDDETDEQEEPEEEEKPKRKRSRQLAAVE
jgi:hypothetical protein